MRSELIAGDTLDFRTSVPSYPASAGWTLTYRMMPRSGGVAITFNAGADGDDYRVQVGASTTANWAPSEYSWSAYVAKAGERYTVEQGLATILANLGTATNFDGRSHARKVLDAINAVLEGRASKDQQEYTIGDRSLKRTPIPDLLVLRDRYQMEVANEDAQAQIAAGSANPRMVRVRFGRA